MKLNQFIAFSIIIVISNTNAITETINAQLTTKGNNDHDGSSYNVAAKHQQQQHALKTTTMNVYYTERELMTLKLMTTDKIAISTAKPSYFNKNSLQERKQRQQHQQQQQQPWTLPHQRHFKDQYTLDNKHQPCDYVEQHTSSIVARTNIIAEGIKITNTGALTTNISTMATTLAKSPSNTTQIDATAKGYKPLGPQHTIIGSIDNNATSFIRNNGGPFYSTTLNVARNGFRDKINISNQRNEFRSDDELADDNNDDNADVVDGVIDDGARTSQRGDTDNYDDGGVDVEVPEKQQQQSAKRLKRKSRTITNDANIKINTKTNTTTGSNSNSNNTSTVESSFFERVELLESGLSPDKHHELQLHRRKRYLLFPEGSSFQLVFDLIIGIVDYTSYAILGITCAVAWELPSKAPSEIVEHFQEKLNEGTFGLQRRNDSILSNEIQYIETQNKPTTTQRPQEYQNLESKATPTTTSYYGHNYPYNREYNRIVADMAVLPGARPLPAAGDNFVETQRKTLNDKDTALWHWNRPDKFYYNKYPKYSDEWSGNDKRKYAADWRQQHGNDNKFNDNAGHDNRDDYRADSFEYSQRKQLKNNAGWQQKDNNWWERNKDRWEEIQQKWEKYGKEYGKNDWQSYTSRRPITTYADYRDQQEQQQQREERQHKILKTPPTHRIYPVFGRRKRSIESSTLPTDLELEMDRLHFREQLRSRQKLYGKIEQLFQTRGHNGTACVLRALCETGQRQHETHEPQQLHLNQRRRQRRSHRHHHHHHRHRQPHSTADQQSEPQSFITELLRTIFALPKDVRNWDDAGPVFQLQQQQELETHMPLHYREAHTYAGDCALRFVSCEHSIWNDGITISPSRYDNAHRGHVGRTFKM